MLILSRYIYFQKAYPIDKLVNEPFQGFKMNKN